MASSPSTAIPKLTEAALARELGVTRQAIHDLVKRSIISKDKDGLIDLDMAKIALANRVRPSGKTAVHLSAPHAPQPAKPSDTESAADSGADDNATSYHVAKTLREMAEAKLAQHKLNELRGHLVLAADVRAHMANRVASLRDALMQIPSRLVPILAAESDPIKIHLALEHELLQALSFVAGDPAAPV